MTSNNNNPGIRLTIVASDTVDEAVMARWTGWLSAAERERARVFRHETDRRNFIVARGTARELLAERHGIPARELSFAADAHGKPEVKHPAIPGTSINWSHSGDRVVVGTADGIPLGVDIERINEDAGLREDVSPFFTDRERRWIAETDGQESASRFFTLWTLKEAFLKATGSGLEAPLNAFSMDISGTGIQCRAESAAGSAANGDWHFYSLCLDRQFMLAAAWKAGEGLATLPVSVNHWTALD